MADEYKDEEENVGGGDGEGGQIEALRLYAEYERKKQSGSPEETKQAADSFLEAEKGTLGEIAAQAAKVEMSPGEHSEPVNKILKAMELMERGAELVDDDGNPIDLSSLVKQAKTALRVIRYTEVPQHEEALDEMLTILEDRQKEWKKQEFGGLKETKRGREWADRISENGGMAIHTKLTAEEADALGTGRRITFETVLKKGRWKDSFAIDNPGDGIYSQSSRTGIGSRTGERRNDPYGADAHWIEVSPPDNDGKMTVRVLLQEDDDRVILDNRGGFTSPLVNIELPEAEARDLVRDLKEDPNLVQEILVAQYPENADYVKTMLDGVKDTQGKYRMVELTPDTIREIRNAGATRKKEVLEKYCQVLEAGEGEAVPSKETERGKKWAQELEQSGGVVWVVTPHTTEEIDNYRALGADKTGQNVLYRQGPMIQNEVLKRRIAVDPEFFKKTNLSTELMDPNNKVTDKDVFYIEDGDDGISRILIVFRSNREDLDRDIASDSLRLVLPTEKAHRLAKEMHGDPKLVMEMMASLEPDLELQNLPIENKVPDFLYIDADNVRREDYQSIGTYDSDAQREYINNVLKTGIDRILEESDGEDGSNSADVSEEVGSDSDTESGENEKTSGEKLAEEEGVSPEEGEVTEEFDFMKEIDEAWERKQRGEAVDYTEVQGDVGNIPADGELPPELVMRRLQGEVIGNIVAADDMTELDIHVKYMGEMGEIADMVDRGARIIKETAGDDGLIRLKFELEGESSREYLLDPESSGVRVLGVEGDNWEMDDVEEAEEVEETEEVEAELMLPDELANRILYVGNDASGNPYPITLATVLAGEPITRSRLEELMVDLRGGAVLEDPDHGGDLRPMDADEAVQAIEDFLNPVFGPPPPPDGPPGPPRSPEGEEGNENEPGKELARNYVEIEFESEVREYELQSWIEREGLKKDAILENAKKYLEDENIENSEDIALEWANVRDFLRKMVVSGGYDQGQFDQLSQLEWAYGRLLKDKVKSEMEAMDQAGRERVAKRGVESALTILRTSSGELGADQESFLELARRQKLIGRELGALSWDDELAEAERIIQEKFSETVDVGSMEMQCRYDFVNRQLQNMTAKEVVEFNVALDHLMGESRRVLDVDSDEFKDLPDEMQRRIREEYAVSSNLDLDGIEDKLSDWVQEHQQEIDDGNLSEKLRDQLAGMMAVREKRLADRLKKYGEYEEGQADLELSKKLIKDWRGIKARLSTGQYSNAEERLEMVRKAGQLSSVIGYAMEMGVYDSDAYNQVLAETPEFREAARWVSNEERGELKREYPHADLVEEEIQRLEGLDTRNPDEERKLHGLKLELKDLRENNIWFLEDRPSAELVEDPEDLLKVVYYLEQIPNRSADLQGRLERLQAAHRDKLQQADWDENQAWDVWRKTQINGVEYIDGESGELVAVGGMPNEEINYRIGKLLELSTQGAGLFGELTEELARLREARNLRQRLPEDHPRYWDEDAGVGDWGRTIDNYGTTLESELSDFRDLLSSQETASRVDDEEDESEETELDPDDPNVRRQIERQRREHEEAVQRMGDELAQAEDELRDLTRRFDAGGDDAPAWSEVERAASRAKRIKERMLAGRPEERLDYYTDPDVRFDFDRYITDRDGYTKERLNSLLDYVHQLTSQELPFNQQDPEIRGKLQNLISKMRFSRQQKEYLDDSFGRERRMELERELREDREKLNLYADRLRQAHDINWAFEEAEGLDGTPYKIAKWDAIGEMLGLEFDVTGEDGSSEKYRVTDAMFQYQEIYKVYSRLEHAKLKLRKDPKTEAKNKLKMAVIGKLQDEVMAVAREMKEGNKVDWDWDESRISEEWLGNIEDQLGRLTASSADDEEGLQVDVGRIKKKLEEEGLSFGTHNERDYEKGLAYSAGAAAGEWMGIPWTYRTNLGAGGFFHARVMNMEQALLSSARRQYPGTEHLVRGIPFYKTSEIGPLSAMGLGVSESVYEKIKDYLGITIEKDIIGEGDSAYEISKIVFEKKGDEDNSGHYLVEKLKDLPRVFGVKNKAAAIFFGDRTNKLNTFRSEVVGGADAYLRDPTVEKMKKLMQSMLWFTSSEQPDQERAMAFIAQRKLEFDLIIRAGIRIPKYEEFYDKLTNSKARGLNFFRSLSERAYGRGNGEVRDVKQTLNVIEGLEKDHLLSRDQAKLLEQRMTTLNFGGGDLPHWWVPNARFRAYLMDTFNPEFKRKFPPRAIYGLAVIAAILGGFVGKIFLDAAMAGMKEQGFGA